MSPKTSRWPGVESEAVDLVEGQAMWEVAPDRTAVGVVALMEAQWAVLEQAMGAVALQEAQQVVLEQAV